MTQASNHVRPLQKALATARRRRDELLVAAYFNIDPTTQAPLPTLPLTIRQLRAHFHVATATIYGAIGRCRRIPNRNPRARRHSPVMCYPSSNTPLSLEDEESTIVQMYEGDGATLVAIQLATKRSLKYIYSVLDAHGVPRRRLRHVSN